MCKRELSKKKDLTFVDITKKIRKVFEFDSEPKELPFYLCYV